MLLKSIFALQRMIIVKRGASFMRIFLASSSPRRKELLSKLDIPFEVLSIDTPEKLNSEKNYYEQCMDIAKEKAQAVFSQVDGEVIVIASDTIVVNNQAIYGKPKDYNDAFKMLKSLSNNKHEVISSLCVLVRKDGQEYQELTYDKCDVYVDNLSDTMIDSWIKNNDVYTRAGGYAIQDGFGKYVTRIDGDYFSIVGFPLHKAWKILQKYLKLE